MFTTGSKFFLGVTALAIVAAALYGWGTDGGLGGVLTVGLDGAVGEQAGLIVLLMLSSAALLIGIFVIAFRDADPDALAEVSGAESVPAATPPAGVSYWPIIGAFAVALVLLGLVVGSALFVAGLILAGIVVIEWTVHAWADRATGDPEVNRQVRNRMMYPFEIPLLGAILIGGVVLGISRVLLSLSKAGSTVVAIVIAVLILGVATVIATRPQFNRTVAAVALVLGALLVLGGGIVAAAHGERDFERHGEEQHEEGLGVGGALAFEAAT